jgi:hypothetical protein
MSQKVVSTQVDTVATSEKFAGILSYMYTVGGGCDSQNNLSARELSRYRISVDLSMADTQFDISLSVNADDVVVFFGETFGEKL